MFPQCLWLSTDSYTIKLFWCVNEWVLNKWDTLLWEILAYLFQLSIYYLPRGLATFCPPDQAYFLFPFSLPGQYLIHFTVPQRVNLLGPVWHLHHGSWLKATSQQATSWLDFLIVLCCYGKEQRSSLLWAGRQRPCSRQVKIKTESPKTHSSEGSYRKNRHT